MSVLRTSLAVTLAALALGACGNRAELKLAPDQTPPPIPYGREVQPGADDLLKPPAQAVPARNVEPRRRSQDREDDPFDLPPEI
ncbi:MAG: hypothetical protein ACOVQ0_11585 [Novosphingobium sp.]|uniref:hypothetical protein n=1 Tax=Novosphingobium sp. TaxID=1874826 RepID=UPI003B9D008E